MKSALFLALLFSSVAHVSVCVITEDLNVRNSDNDCSKSEMLFKVSCDGEATKTIRKELLPDLTDYFRGCNFTNQPRLESAVLASYQRQGYRLVGVSGVSFYLEK